MEHPPESTASSAGVDKAHYHGWRGKLRTPWIGCLAIVRVALLQVFRRKSYWFVIGLGLLSFLTFFALIYIATQLGGLRMRVLESMNFHAEPSVDTENGYLRFMELQGMVVMILLAFSGSLLVGADFRLKSLPFYLSRRIARRHYILGKLLAVGAVVSLLTIVPALALFLEFGAFTSSFDYWIENWRIVVSILGYGFVLCASLSVTLVTLSAYLQRTAPIAITWSSIFLLAPVVRRQMKDITGNVYWNLVDPWRDIRYVGRYCFGFFPQADDQELGLWAAGILAAVCLLCLAALTWRVRAIEVVN